MNQYIGHSELATANKSTSEISMIQCKSIPKPMQANSPFEHILKSIKTRKNALAFSLKQNQNDHTSNNTYTCTKNISNTFSRIKTSQSPLPSSFQSISSQKHHTNSIPRVISKEDLKKHTLVPPHSMPKQDDDCSDNFLHRTCQLFPKSLHVIKSALSLNPASVSSRATIAHVSKASNRRMKNKQTREPCTLPINIAIQNRASADVVELLVRAGNKSVLRAKDGQDQCGSLCIALHQKPISKTIVELLLDANPQGASCPDRRMNYPLHLACSAGAPIELVSRVYSAYPEALTKKNISGETPLDIVQRHSRCSEEVLDFLQDASFKGCSTDDV